MNPGTAKPAVTWFLAIGGGLVAGASMSLFDQGMTKVIVPAVAIAVFAFASTFFTQTRQRTAFLAWLGGGLATAVAATGGRYLELTAAARQVVGADATPAELAVATDAALANAKLGLMAVLLTVVTFVLAVLPVLLGAVARPKETATPQLGAAF